MKYLLAILLFSCTASRKANTVTVDASKSYDPDGRIVKYEWRVKGVTVGTGVTVAVNRNTTVQLIVTDDKGATGTATRLITDTSK